jgi:hypothetical protein
MGKSYKKQTDPLVFKNTRTRSYDRTERKNLNQQIRIMKYNVKVVDPEIEWDEEDFEEYEDEDWDLENE